MPRIELSIDAINQSIYVNVNGQPVARFTDHKKAEGYALSLMGFES